MSDNRSKRREARGSEAAAWRKAIAEAAARRDFPNVLFAMKWIRALSKAGAYPRSWNDDRGD